MNRRQVLTNAVTGIGAIALASLNVPNASAADEPKKKTTKEADAFSITVCPLYPSMSHGTYTSYYALEKESGCANPRMLDGPNGLGLGCPNGTGCTLAFREVSLAAASFESFEGVHPDTDAEGCGGTPSSGAHNHGVTNIVTDNVLITVQKPSGNTKQVWVKLVESVFTPRDHDHAIVKAAVLAAGGTAQQAMDITAKLNSISGSVENHNGHEIANGSTPNPPTTSGRFGQLNSTNPIPIKGGKNHVVNVEMKKQSVLRNFSVILKKPL